ncbi:ABC transporter permease subunit [Massilia sp. CFBP9012]|uniref:ABC transporter permease subunit n=1 Tax=Massilia sp. CFBP9012 TaxID=3096531 RepID=UPI002A69EDAE|nr:ABC transporter permease subunit [Massilia sp. CFBP9012]MDY0973827.1 ABC transporter permease subunit [Massilia sp. CFBP9012]
MSATLTIIRMEGRRLLRGRWLLPLWLLFGVMCACAAWNGAAWVEGRQATLALILEDERATHAMRRTQLAEQVTPDNKSRYGGALYATAMSLRATLPPGELALLTVGQAEGYPMAATVFPFIASNTIFDRHTAGMENPAVLAAGRFDLAFAIVWLLPLLVLAGSFDLFAFERERGMAPWLLSQPVTPAHLLAAKTAARALLLALPLAAIVVATLAFASQAGPAALLQAGGLVLLYALFWLVLALLVNLVACNAAQAALGCLAAWLAMVVLLPALALGVADLAAPPVSQAERANALRAMAMQARAELRTAVAPDRVPAPNIPDSLRRRALEVERGERLIQEALQPYRAQQAQRLAWLDGLRVVSPAIALQDALERLAGSDAGRALRFQDQAHGFLLEVRRIVRRHLDQDRLLTVADYDRGLPRFLLREAPPARRLGALLFDAAVIVLGMTALLLAAGRRLRRHATFTE